MHPLVVAAFSTALQDTVPDSLRFVGSGVPKGVVMVVVLGLLYLLPTFLAFARTSQRRFRVLTVNVLLGWTVIGWIAALIMTFAYEPAAAGSAPDTPHIPGRAPRE
jgi:uncharacterized membrane protein YGL010W